MSKNPAAALRERIRAARTRTAGRPRLAWARYQDQSVEASVRVPFTQRGISFYAATPYGHMVRHARQDRVWGYEPREPRPARSRGRGTR